MKFETATAGAMVAWIVIYLLLGTLAVLQRGLREKVVRYLVLYTGLAAFSQLLQLIGRLGWLDAASDSLITWVPLFETLILITLFVLLGGVLLGVDFKKRIWLLAAAGGLLLALLVLLLNLLEIWRGAWQRWLVLLLLLAGWLGLVVQAVSITMTAYRQAKHPLHRNRVVYWVLALNVVVLGDLLLFAGVNIIAATFRIIGIVLVAYIMLIHNLRDLYQTVLQVLTFLVMTTAAVVVYAAGFALIESLKIDEQGASPFWVGLLLALVLVVLFNPIWNRLTRQFYKLIVSGGYETTSAIREYSQSISNIVDLELLTDTSCGLIQKTFSAENARLFIVDEVRVENHSVYAIEQAVPNLEEEELITPGRLASDSPVKLYFNHAHRPLTQYDLDFLPEVNKLAVNEREWFANLDADVFIPIHSKLEWIGMFALGHKTSGNRYYEDDLNLLCTLADQTAVALENARLFSDLMHLNRDLKQTHAALEDANQQLREIDGLKSAFIGKVTHELRTPFANIGFSLQVLERFGVEHLLPEQREQLKQLNNGVKLARKMVDNLITFASFINRQVGLNLEKVNFGQLMTETLVPLKDQAKTKGVEFYVEVVGELLPVLGDRKLISEAVYQLAHNAVKFTRAGGEVRVSCWIASGLLFFDIKDTGIGIPSDRLDGIWQGFDQEADSVRRGLEGLGLGLALVKFIVNAHGGEVWVESQLRVGSDFGFKIPLAGPPQ